MLGRKLYYRSEAAIQISPERRVLARTILRKPVIVYCANPLALLDTFSGNPMIRGCNYVAQLAFIVF
jgi:hypothetical protein